MTIENIRIPVEARERDAVLKDMSEKGYTLVAVTSDGVDRKGLIDFHYWSLYFTKRPSVIVIPLTPCCERDNDGDGNCDIHSAPGVLRKRT